MIHPAEGDIYKVYEVGNHIFEIRYGYYEESERGRVEPLPVFPDLMCAPLFTETGQPIVTLLQKPCVYYTPNQPARRELWCGDCLHYSGGREEIGFCRCPARKSTDGGKRGDIP